MACSVNADRPRQDVDDPAESDTPGDVDGKILAADLIECRQALKLPSVGAGDRWRARAQFAVDAAEKAYPAARFRAAR